MAVPASVLLSVGLPLTLGGVAFIVGVAVASQKSGPCRPGDNLQIMRVHYFDFHENQDELDTGGHRSRSRVKYSLGNDQSLPLA